MRCTRCCLTMSFMMIDSGLVFDRIIIIINVQIHMLSSTFIHTRLRAYYESISFTLLVSIFIVQAGLIFGHFKEASFLIRCPLFH